MEALRTIAAVLAATLAACGTASAGEEYPGDDLWAPYTQRTDKATATSGNAQEVNSITHIITPWPPYVADRRIPGDAERMVGAIRRYRDPRATGGVPPVPPATPGSSAGADQPGAGGQGGASGNSAQGQQ